MREHEKSGGAVQARIGIAVDDFDHVGDIGVAG